MMTPDLPCAVAVVTYGWPRLMELQVRLIRETCGPVPILLVDDCSPAQWEIASLASRYAGVDFRAPPKRRGHLAGDLWGYAAALRWAAGQGSRVLAKLSRRLLITRPQWLQEGGGVLLRSGKSLASQPCEVDGHPFPVRSEAALLDVRRWSRPEVWARLELPPNPPGVLPIDPEAILWAVATQLGATAPWPLLPADRRARGADVLWHDSHTAAEYEALAARFGLGLDADFTAKASQSLPDYVRG